MECRAACSVQAMTTAAEKLAACWARTMTTDMNASKNVTCSVCVGCFTFRVSLSISVFQSTLMAAQPTSRDGNSSLTQASLIGLLSMNRMHVYV